MVEKWVFSLVQQRMFSEISSCISFLWISDSGTEPEIQTLNTFRQLINPPLNPDSLHGEFNDMNVSSERIESCTVASTTVMLHRSAAADPVFYGILLTFEEICRVSFLDIAYSSSQTSLRNINIIKFFAKQHCQLCFSFVINN